MTGRMQDFDAFWLRYLRAHANPAARALHYAGSLLALLCLVAAVALRDWRWLIAAPLIGYGFAWTAHVFVQRNRPETFGHPVWSLLCDCRMLGLWLIGRLTPHLRRAGV